MLWPQLEWGTVTHKNYDRVAIGAKLVDVESILGADNCTDWAFNGILWEFGDPVYDSAGVRFGGLAGFPGDMIDSDGYVRISSAKREVRYWQGGSGVVGVYFIDGRVGSKRWLRKPSIVDRIKRQWRRWFPE